MNYQNIDLEPLALWFQENRRAFAWRENPTPYRVWISEVMLQQTQSERVIAYFEKWMRLFPTATHLAHAALEEVLKAWEGLGYYSRARQLHEAAKYLVTHFDGQIPSQVYELEQIKGLGPYTISAIRAFGFQEHAAPVDANVMRVLCRLFEIEDDIAKAKTQLTLRQIAERILPKHKSWVFAEALIELGATVCKPKAPQCVRCPLQSQCQAYANQSQIRLPVKTKKMRYEALFRDVAIIFSKAHILLQQGQKGKVMADLYEFAYFESEAGGISPKMMQNKITESLGIKAIFSKELEVVKHAFTRFRVTLYPKIFEAPDQQDVTGYEWHRLEDAHKLAFSAGHKRILSKLIDLQR